MQQISNSTQHLMDSLQAINDNVHANGTAAVRLVRLALQILYFSLQLFVCCSFLNKKNIVICVHVQFISNVTLSVYGQLSDMATDLRNWVCKYGTHFVC